MIDWTRVTELRDEIGEESFAEVVTLFLDETDEVTEKLVGVVSPDEMARALHFLKGSALNLGFSELATLCQDGERNAALGAVDQVDLAQVLQCYRASKTVFRQELSQRIPA